MIIGVIRLLEHSITRWEHKLSYRRLIVDNKIVIIGELHHIHLHPLRRRLITHQLLIFILFRYL